MSTISNIQSFQQACQNLFNNPNIPEANSALNQLIGKIRAHQERWFDFIADIFPDSADFQHIIILGKALSYDQVLQSIQSLRTKPAEEQTVPDLSALALNSGFDILCNDVFIKIVDNLSIKDASEFCQLSHKCCTAVRELAQQRWDVIKNTSNNETLNALITEIDAKDIPHLKKLYELCHECNPMVSSKDLRICDITSKACIQRMKDHATLVLCQKLCEIIPDNNFTTTLRTHLDNQDLTEIRNYLHSNAQLLAAIEELKLSFKFLRMIPEEIRYCTNLTKLNLNINHIRQIDANTFHGLRALTHLYLNYNLIQQIDTNTFSELRALQHLDLSSNCIRQIDTNTFSELRALRHLDLSHNQIRQIDANDFFGLQALMYLYLNNTHIRQIDANTFHGLRALTHLYLNYNLIQQIDANAFFGLHALMYLYLNNNRIRQIDTNTFSELRALERIYLSDNPIPSINHLILPNRCLVR